MPIKSSLVGLIKLAFTVCHIQDRKGRLNRGKKDGIGFSCEISVFNLLLSNERHKTDSK